MTKYKGYTLTSRPSGMVDIYQGSKYVTWALTADQAKRIVDGVQS